MLCTYQRLSVWDFEGLLNCTHSLHVHPSFMLSRRPLMILIFIIIFQLFWGFGRYRCGPDSSYHISCRIILQYFGRMFNRVFDVYKTLSWDIILFIVITLCCRTDIIMRNFFTFILNVRNILHNIVSLAKYFPHWHWMWRIFYIIMSVQHNIVMAMNNVMEELNIWRIISHVFAISIIGWSCFGALSDLVLVMLIDAIWMHFFTVHTIERPIIVSQRGT